MTKTLHNRIRQAERTAAYRKTQIRSGGLGELYRLIREEPETLSPELQQILKEMNA